MSDTTSPFVTREPLRKDVEEIILHCEDSPKRPGYEPVNGDQDNALMFPLSDGRRLVLHCGKETYAHFVAILAAAMVDDAEREINSE